jgi:hypothetical protein
MTTIVPAFTKLRSPAGGIDAIVATWTPLAASGDVGQPLQRVDLPDRSVQVAGTFAGATIVFEGSNDGANYFTLASPSGAALSFTAAGLVQVNMPAAFVRPHVTLGSGASLTVTMTARRTIR